MFDKPQPGTAPRLAPHNAQPSAWSSARINRSLDQEMAALLRAHLVPDFDQAQNWADLAKRLRAKGFYLKTDGQRVRLHDCHSHVQICSCRFLGFPSARLEARFNRLH